MKLKRLEFKNFASYGNRTQVIEFDKDRSDLFLVLGQNGAGKSTLAKVITYMCYGRVDGANLRDLANRVNGNLWGKIWLESKGNNVIIERGILPGIFKVEVNGSEYDVAGKTNLQDFLETEIFEIPFHVFKNVIILSVNDFKSFITMSPYDKKLIVDKIFGFSIINQMRELVKEKKKGILNEIRTFDDEIRTLDESIQSIQHKIEEIEKLSKEKDANKIKELKDRLIKLNDNRKILKDAILKNKERLQNYESSVKTMSSKKSELKHRIDTIKKDLTLYDQNCCPTCQGPLDSQFHQNIKNEKENLLVSNFSELKNVEDQLVTEELSLSQLRDKGREIHVRIAQLETQMENIKNELLSFSNGMNDTESSNFKELVTEFSKKKLSKSEERLGYEAEDNYFSILESIMGEDGIKNMAIRSILPALNNNVLLMGKEMGIPFAIRFDDKFNCTLHHLGNEISAKTLSTGERKKVDFVIIMALIKMIKVRFPSLNILFLDEIFSSIDSDGVYHIIKILHETIHEIGLNTFVINHTVLPSEYFDKKLEITKDAGFSEFSIESII
jgi:DNA repair exonuclease SbcCD ATPase subunit